MWCFITTNKTFQGFVMGMMTTTLIFHACGHEAGVSTEKVLDAVRSIDTDHDGQLTAWEVWSKYREWTTHY